MILMTESEEVIRLLPECHALLLGNLMKIQKNNNKNGIQKNNNKNGI